MRHLLGHSSGLPDYLEINRKNEKNIFDIIFEEGDRSWSIQDFVNIVRDANRPHFDPQDLDARKRKVCYSDTNFQLLIAVIRQVTGKSPGEVFEEMIFSPLGLKNTFYPGTRPETKTAKIWYKDKPLDIELALASFGDLNSTVDDMLVFMRALISGKIFDNPSTFKMMCNEWNRFGLSVSPVRPGWPIEYGLGIMRFRYPWFLSLFSPVPEVIGHTGVSGSWLFYCPPLDIMTAGSVNQITAAAVPFEVVPKILRSITKLKA